MNILIKKGGIIIRFSQNKALRTSQLRFTQPNIKWKSKMLSKHSVESVENPEVFKTINCRKLYCHRTKINFSCCRIVVLLWNFMLVKIVTSYSHDDVCFM